VRRHAQEVSRQQFASRMPANRSGRCARTGLAVVSSIDVIDVIDVHCNAWTTSFFNAAFNDKDTQWNIDT
jgi:hypothetical protein